MRCLISFVSVEWMSSLFFIGGDHADPMPGKNERQGRSTNIFFFHEGSLQGHGLLTFFFFSSCSSFLRGFFLLFLFVFFVSSWFAPIFLARFSIFLSLIFVLSSETKNAQ